MNNNKRKYRNDMSDEQKQKISQKMQGRKLSMTTRQKISKSLTDYWNSLPIKPHSNNDKQKTLDNE